MTLRHDSPELELALALELPLFNLAQVSALVQKVRTAGSLDLAVVLPGDDRPKKPLERAFDLPQTLRLAAVTALLEAGASIMPVTHNSTERRANRFTFSPIVKALETRDQALITALALSATPSDAGQMHSSDRQMILYALADAVDVVDPADYEILTSLFEDGATARWHQAMGSTRIEDLLSTASAARALQQSRPTSYAIDVLDEDEEESMAAVKWSADLDREFLDATSPAISSSPVPTALTAPPRSLSTLFPSLSRAVRPFSQKPDDIVRNAAAQLRARARSGGVAVSQPENDTKAIALPKIAFFAGGGSGAMSVKR